MPYAAPQQLSEQPIGQLENVHQSFGNYNDRQVNLLQELEEKLHRIINRKNPQKDGGTEKSMPNDAIQALNIQLDRLCNQNDWIERLLGHLSEII